MLSSQGTAIRDAIQTAIDYFQNSGQASKILMILSDGEDHEQGVEDVLQEVKDRGIRIFTIGLGTAQGATIPITENGATFPKRDSNGEVVITKLNQPLLEALAQGASGKYFDGANTRQVLDNIQKAFENIEKTSMNPRYSLITKISFSGF